MEADSRRGFVTAEKTNLPPKKGQGDAGSGGITASVLRGPDRSVADFTGPAESNCSVKCERHTIAALKSWRRRRASSSTTAVGRS